MLDIDKIGETKKSRAFNIKNVITQKELQPLSTMAPSQLLTIDSARSVFEQLGTLPGEVPIGTSPAPVPGGEAGMEGGMGMGMEGGIGGGGMPPAGPPGMEGGMGGGMGAAAPLPGMEGGGLPPM